MTDYKSRTYRAYNPSLNKYIEITDDNKKSEDEKIKEHKFIGTLELAFEREKNYIKNNLLRDVATPIEEAIRKEDFSIFLQ